MIHNPEDAKRIKKEGGRRLRPSPRLEDPRVGAALRKGDEALERAGIERQGGTGVAGMPSREGVPGGATVLLFGIAFGSVNHAAAVLKLAELDFPFEVRSYGRPKPQ